ncbi:MAG: phosphoadenylyl-sulfate reductase [Hyphomicrobium sp.]
MTTLIDAVPERAPSRSPEAADGIAEALNRDLAALDSLTDRIRLIAARIPGRIAFSTSLGVEDQAVLDAIASAEVKFDVFTLDTGRHFPETLDTLFDSQARYGVPIRVLFPEAGDVETLVAEDGIYGFRYSIDARKACCDVRKVRPLNKALAGAAAWITGLRREQSQGRADVPFAIYDPEQRLIKVNPLADWTLARLDGYIAANKVPVNALHAKGFPSIGCQPCTRAIAPGEDIRAGRWWWENDNGKECGLHSRSAAATPNDTTAADKGQRA